MPFPWKKMKNTMISQLLTDHLDSQRRRRLGGPPLVVETGFPTSLVDLFVKNRQRLKKPSKMEKKETNSWILKSPSPLPVPSASPEVPSSSSSSYLTSTLLSNMVEETDGVVERLKEEDENFKGVLLGVLRMLFVVVLALGTKKFAAGLTMSAFFLFFVEYVGIYLYRLLIPCSEAKKRLRLMIKRVFRFIRIREENLEEGNRGFKVSKQGQQEATKSGFADCQDQRLIRPICEIEIIQPKRFLVPFLEDIQCQKEEEPDQFTSDGKLKLPGSNSDVMVLEKEEEYRCEVLEFKKRKSRRAKIKAKMKNIFARKSRSAKKEEGNLDGEISPIGRKNVMTSEEQESGHENGRELKSSCDLSSILSGSYEGDETLDVICNSRVLLEEDAGGVVIGEEENIQNNGNSGYLSLCLIVLIGLFGGRISALMFILSWFFVKKSDGKLRRCLTWPVIRFFYPNA